MRLPFSVKNFDAVFNLFTSLGYFKDINENFFVFKNVSNALNPNGIFVVDFFNAKKGVLFESKLWGMIIYNELENKDILEMR